MAIAPKQTTTIINKKTKTEPFRYHPAKLKYATNAAGTRQYVYQYAYAYIVAGIAADADRHYFELYLGDDDPVPTYLGVTFQKNTACGIIDIYLNEVLIGATTDTYAAAAADGIIAPSPAGNWKRGLNKVTIVLNSKHASSTDYEFRSYFVYWI